MLSMLPRLCRCAAEFVRVAGQLSSQRLSASQQAYQQTDRLPSVPATRLGSPLKRTTLVP